MSDRMTAHWKFHPDSEPIAPSYFRTDKNLCVEMMNNWILEIQRIKWSKKRFEYRWVRTWPWSVTAGVARRFYRKDLWERGEIPWLGHLRNRRYLPSQWRERNHGVRGLDPFRGHMGPFLSPRSNQLPQGSSLLLRSIASLSCCDACSALYHRQHGQGRPKQRETSQKSGPK